MRRFIIERNIPQIGSAERDALRAAAQKSNSVLAELAPDIQLQQPKPGLHALTLQDRRRPPWPLGFAHAEMSGLPANKITEVSKTIDPTTARP